MNKRNEYFNFCKLILYNFGGNNLIKKVIQASKWNIYITNQGFFGPLLSDFLLENKTLKLKKLGKNGQNL